jgi:fucose 4-O-acetylase-like acetyltransferase
MAKTKRRISLFDLIKCIAILAVVCGHTATTKELNSNPALFYKAVYSFHMHLFFFAAGLSFSPRALRSWEEWRSFLRKGILTLLVPYIVWALIYCDFSFESVASVLYGSWRSLKAAGSLTSLWFLASLFVAKLFVQLLINGLDFLGFRAPRNVNECLGAGRAQYAVPGALLVIAGYFLVPTSCNLPWCVDSAVAAAGFILLGIALRNSLVELSVQRRRVVIAAALLSCAVFGCILAFEGDGLAIAMMCRSEYGRPLVSLGLALSGSALAVSAACLLRRLTDEWVKHLSLNGLIYIGRHTMGIFLLHKLMMQKLIIPGLEAGLGACLPLGVIRCLGACAALTVSLLLCALIERYVPQLIGVYGRESYGSRGEAV